MSKTKWIRYVGDKLGNEIGSVWKTDKGYFQAVGDCGFNMGIFKTPEAAERMVIMQRRRELQEMMLALPELPEYDH